MHGGAFVDVEGRLLELDGRVIDVDPAIGTVHTRHGPFVYGELGLQFVPPSAHLGPVIRRLDPSTEGTSPLPFPEHTMLARRPDGSFTIFPDPQLSRGCE